MTDAVQAAILAAQANAANHTQTSAPGVTSLPATQTTGTAVGAVTSPGQAFSMETVGAGQMSVDQWLKVKEHGLLIGDGKTLHDSIKVTLDMTDRQGFMVKQGIKGGNPAQYAYTFDGAVANDGKPWDQAISRIRQLDAKASPYPCVDLPFVVDEEVKDKAGAVEIEAGKRLGYTTSTTNWANWKLFYDEVKGKGLLGQKVAVELGVQARTNKNGNAWGVVTFKLLGLAATDEAAD